ncbi:AAA family ATPase [Emticicia sp. 21SJ11W-3]|uniref:AAA family ATPase n=1 Tax=Emticicia sp. 21SJ11W-3 TaxID=2916755 RepID=UPI0020A1C265|nr:AAA family ATPase [Emticicia sp. 21SJ11W-3]UTA69053.1 AAA family ATPase [Emticicia sp. 21SJ11W-3]
MKILAIRIKNLASLEGNTEIDFCSEPLCSAGIFAITGSTGAGKSTILDALCLALYGKTPRYLQARESGIEITDAQGGAISQGDVRGILRDGTGDGFAEVDFVGVDGQRYRTTWRVRRARDRADGSLQQYSITLKNIDTNTDTPGKKNEILEEIERLVGLNFEQFTRSVLLAQGDFTAFLKAAKDEKSALLEKLTGTRIYSEISKQIFVNYSKEKRELEDLNLQREGIPTLTSEEVEDLKQQKVTLEQNITIQQKEEEALTKEIGWHIQLAVLQTSVTEAHATQAQAIEAKQNTAGREQQLKQVERVQPTRTWVDGQQTTEKQLADKTASLQDLQTTLSILQQQQVELDEQLQTANETTVGTIQKQEAAAPQLEEARALDVQIKEKAEQVNQAVTEVKPVEVNHQQLQQQLQAQQQQSQQLLDSISQLQQWKQDNSSRQPIAENYSLISVKLGDAEKLLDVAQALLPQLQHTQTAIAEAKQAKTELETTLAAITQQLQAEKEKHTKASVALVAIPISSLEKEKASTDSCIEDIIVAEAHWKILSHGQADLDTLKQKLLDNKSELNDRSQSLAQSVAQLGIATAERDSSLRMLDKARLAAAENVESLRLQLIPEESCPVCGSTAHPYVTEHTQLNHVLAELEATHQQNDKVYSACLQIESSLKETVNRLKETIASQEQETDTKETALAVHQKTWEGLAIYPLAAEIPNQQKATWLEQQLQHARAQQKRLQQQILLYATKKQELDALQNTINELERRQNENSYAVKDTDRRLQSLQEQEAQYHKEQQNNNQALVAIEKSLSAYFVATDWFTHWRKDAALFLQRIGQFAERWKTTTQKLEDDSRQHSILTAALEATKGQLHNALVDLQKKQAALLALIEQQDILTQKRKAIFNGEAAADIEQGLKQAVTSAQQALEKIKTEREQLQTSLTRIGTQKEQTEKDIASLQQHISTFAQRIQEWVTEFNIRNTLTLDKDRLSQLLTYDAAWIETERTALRAIDDAITQAHSVLKERNTQLLQHERRRLSERSAEVLSELLNTVRTDLQQQGKRNNEIGFQLQQDLSNKQRVGDLLGVIETKGLITENWAKLNDIIGSADGKKFRLIAQEYTLDVLLSYANVHLGMLSNRYVLQRIPNTIGLQVIDQDMGDEVRTVYSLSGGESFLTSLALALGLASLSSSRMQVESLFIDEGFGSLDPVTLNIAMDALERLHNQGRKVGVISHVQEMTERIPVQIKVSKQQSGRSKVEII